MTNLILKNWRGSRGLVCDTSNKEMCPNFVSAILVCQCVEVEVLLAKLRLLSYTLLLGPPPHAGAPATKSCKAKMMKLATLAAIAGSAAAFAPAQQGRASTAVQGFENELGVIAPTGFFDPLGLSKVSCMLSIFILNIFFIA